MEFSRPEYWSGLPFPSPGDLPNPGIAVQADSLPTEPQGKSISKYDKMLIVESGWWVYGYSWKNSFKFSACLEFFIIVYQGGGSKSNNNLAGLYSGLKDMVFIRYIGVVGVLSVQFSSVQSLSCVRLCDPMNHSTPGLPVHHQLPEFTQTHVHRVSDAILPSYPLLSPSPVPNPSQHQGPFQWVNSSHEVECYRIQ